MIRLSLPCKLSAPATVSHPAPCCAHHSVDANVLLTIHRAIADTQMSTFAIVFFIVCTYKDLKHFENGIPIYRQIASQNIESHTVMRIYYFTFIKFFLYICHARKNTSLL